MESNEQKAAREIVEKKAKRAQQRRERRETETEKERVERLAKQREYNQKWRANETPEKNKERLLKQREYDQKHKEEKRINRQLKSAKKEQKDKKEKELVQELGIEQGRVSTSSGINRLPSFNETFNRFGNWQTPQQTDYQPSRSIQHDPLSLFLSDEEKKSTGRDNAFDSPRTRKGIDQQAWNDCLEGASPSQNYSQNDELAPIQPVQQLSDTNVEHLQGPNMQS